MRLFRKFKRGSAQDASEGIRTAVSGDRGLVTVDLDSFGPGAQKKLAEEIAKINRLPLFEGTIEHGFSKRAAGSTDKCPGCGAATRQQNANFVYATDIAPRVMLVPAGYFCSLCPTVIVDEDLIAAGMKQGYRYRCVVGIDYFGKKDFEIFKTWNGKKPIYVLNENQQLMDMTTEDELGQQQPSRSKYSGKEKQKRKMERIARRRNRRK